MLEIYDDALIRFFSQLRWKGKAVPVVVAGPDRAHAQIHDWLRKNSTVSPSRSQGEYPTPYPFVAVDREVFKPNSGLYSPALLRNLHILRDEGYGFAVRRPKPVTAGVDVNMYFNDKVQADFFTVILHNLFPFPDRAWIPVDFTDPRWYRPPNDALEFCKIMGQQKLQFDLDSIVDSSSLERAGLERKEIRMTLSCTLHGWIPFQPYAVPLAKTIEIVVADDVSEKEIVTVTEDGD